MAITDAQLMRLNTLIEQGQEHNFYLWGVWKHICVDVKKIDHNECQFCKSAGRYRRGTIVHHIKHLRDRPDLALSIYDPDTGERQLVLVCKDCHEEQHPEAFRQNATNKRQPLTEERWD